MKQAFDRKSATEKCYDDAIRADKLSLLYHQSFPAVFLSLASASLLTAILWPHTEHDVLLAWMGALLLASIGRLTLFLRYRRAAPTGLATLPWSTPYLITLLISSLVWGLGGLWIMPADSLLYASVVFYFLMGMAAGAISAYSAVRSFAIATIFAVLGPATLWMLAQGERTPVIMGVAACLLIFAALRATRAMSRSMHESFVLAQQLEQARVAAEQLARTDALTGLNNRRAFSELALAAIGLSDRHDAPVSAIVMDLDHFKHINDSWGHSVGDSALQQVARVLQNSVRKSDICARHGGEEFAVLLPDTDLQEAIQVAEKIRRAIELQPVQTPDGEFIVTASFGVAGGDHDLDDLLGRADTAMYRAKQTGRNRVLSHPLRPLDVSDTSAGQEGG